MLLEQLEEMRRLEDTYWWFVARRKLVRQLTHRYAGTAGLRILDVGCGTGGTMEAMAGLGEIWGCDISQEALQMCRRRGVTNLVHSRAEELGLASSSFDVALSCDVLEHIEDDELALREMGRILRPGGRAIITVPAHQWLWSDHDRALLHLRRYSRRQFAAKLQAAGLRPLKLTYAVSTLFGPAVVLRAMQRLRLRPGPPETGLIILPAWLNRLFVALLDMETCLIVRRGLPVGLSLVCVAEPEGDVA